MSDQRARENLYTIISSIIKAIEGGCRIVDLKADVDMGEEPIGNVLADAREGDIEIKFYLKLERPKIENKGTGRIPAELERDLNPG